MLESTFLIVEFQFLMVSLPADLGVAEAGEAWAESRDVQKFQFGTRTKPFLREMV